MWKEDRAGIVEGVLIAEALSLGEEDQIADLVLLITAQTR
jgi:hypothetical protein